MLKFFTKTRRRKVLTGVAACFVVAAAAYAYFTLQASGNGSGQVGSANGAIELSGSSNDALTPGGPDGTVSGSAHNTGSSASHLGDVTVSVTSTSDPNCAPSNFEVDGPVHVNQQIGAGQTVPFSTQIRMKETNQNQDACQNASLNLHFSGTSS